MMNNFNYMGWGGGNYFYGGFWFLVMAIALWALVWKAFALYKAARRGDVYWFVALLILNTAGILEILYLFAFSEPKGLVKDRSNTVKEGEKKS